MTPPPEQPEDSAAPRSSETVAILEFATPSGLTVALVTPSGLTPAHPSGPHSPVPLTPAFRPSASMTQGIAPGPDLSSSVGASATSPGVSPVRRLVARAVTIAGLLAALAWGIVEVRKLSNVERHPPRDAQDSVAAPTIPADTGADDAFLDEDAVDDAAVPGKRAATFLRTRVKRDGDLEGPPVEIAAAVTAQAVTVVNFWATWCVPCKEEFSGFQSMFELNRRDSSWGNETRFVPILVDDYENARTAYATWRNSMPDIHMALIDQKLDQGGARGGLGPTRLLDAQPDALPVTLLFDCRRRIRWFKVGALDQAAFNALADEVDVLRGELGKEKCKPPPLRSRPSTPSTPVSLLPETKTEVPDTVPVDRCNHNNKCDAHEDCKRCPAECGCKSGQKCAPRPGQLFFCKEDI